MENQHHPFWHVAIRESTPCVPLRLSTVSTTWHSQFAVAFEFFWRALLAQDRSLRFRFDEHCTVRAADGTGSAPRACRHAFFLTMVDYQLERRTGVRRKLFRCMIPGCGLRFESMSSLHIHQAESCIPACYCDTVLSRRIRAYTECTLANPAKTCVPCGWSVASWRTVGLSAAMVAHRQHCAEFHGQYECADAWCTSALCEGIVRVCNTVHSDTVAVSLRRCLRRCSDRIQALLGRSYDAADVATV